MTTPQPVEPDIRILVVDDEPEVRAGVTRILRLEGYAADEADSGEQALRMLNQAAYKVIILDLYMPGLDGLAVMRQVRYLRPGILIIILTGHANLESAIAATKADEVIDYLLKPTSNQEIIQAVQRAGQKYIQRQCQQRIIDAANQLLRAVETSPDPPATEIPSLSPGVEEIIHAPPLTVDRAGRVVTNEDKPDDAIELTKGEMLILVALMRAPNKVLSCRELVCAAWNYETSEHEAASVVRPCISRLRRKLETDPKRPRLIQTVRRRGYSFSPTEK